MNAHDYGTLIRLVATLGLLWGLGVLWRRHAVEKFRHDMFVIRDSLFDLADANRHTEFTFGKPAYEEFRSELNAIIRFAHRISFGRSVLFHFARRAFCPHLGTSQIVRSIIAKIDDESIRLVINEKVRSMNWKILKFMMKTSPACLLLTIGVIIRVYVDHLKGVGPRVNAPAEDTGINIALGGGLALSPIREIKKRTAHRMRAMHAAVWVESREHADDESLEECPSSYSTA